jgi:N-acetylmuramoyl-L-alanine amidase
MTDVVIDPGHGGAAPVGGSSPLGARGAGGVLEKDVTLRLARRVLAHLGPGPSAQLTREGDVNVPLAERAAAAGRAGARVFVSLHANAGGPGERGCETWVHSRADGASVSLARAVQRALTPVCGPDRGVLAADLAVLRAEHLGGRAAACLVEVGFLSHPAGEAQLADPRHLDAAAKAIARAVRAHLASRAGRDKARYGSIIRAFDTYSKAFDSYAPPDARAYAPSAAYPFRCAPTPASVSPATEWPASTGDPDAASEAALRALGVGDAGVAGYRGVGFDSLRPIARVFGQAALTELMARLRYTAAQLARPPHSFGDLAGLRRAFGPAVTEQAVLAVRLLLAIPGHFRELARAATAEREAHAVESLGWLLMGSLAGDVGTATGKTWWLPSPPVFVTPFPNPLPPLSAATASLVTAMGLIDTTLEYSDYDARFAAWSVPQAGRASAGRAWRLETGVEASALGAGMPFYPELVTPPPVVSVAAQRAQVQAAWATRLSDFDAGKNTTPLTQCDDRYVASLGLTAPNALGGLELLTSFPAPSTRRPLSSLEGLAQIRAAWELAFQTVRDLGWNDLLFQTGGMLCFRGTKIQGNPAAARRMSNHASGTAGDFNDFENRQMTASGAMDPRIVAVFEAMNFRWGQCFRNAQGGAIPDPMHFEYA